ncbi:MAG TPA: helix-turn-helix domain-containing protein [Solirubrobacterales bacterium]|nr:helix-turn-helix domain-containing protein [Solirubrobacterales bacterium]
MDISKATKITPTGPPASTADESYVWTQLAPRLLNPGALAIIKTLLCEGRPLSAVELAELLELSVEHARYHCKAMERRGALEVVQLHPQPEGDDDEPSSYFFPKPPRAVPSSSPSTPATAA